MWFPGEMFGYRKSTPEEDIIKYIENSDSFDPAEEDLDNAQALKIFDTSKQRTWIVSTKKRLYCILDDINRDDPVITWALSREDVTDGNEVTINIDATKEKTERTGFVDFGEHHRNWLYSKRLFERAGESVTDSVIKLIRSTMIT